MSRRRGNDGENRFMALAEAIGYCAFAARGSRGPIDVVCFNSQPNALTTGLLTKTWRSYTGRDFEMRPLVVQVGTASKPIARTLAELDAAPRPIGSLCIVARRMPLKGGRRPWRFHTPYGTFATLEEAIASR